jgi:hypothetical protein
MKDADPGANANKLLRDEHRVVAGQQGQAIATLVQHDSRRLRLDQEK